MRSERRTKGDRRSTGPRTDTLESWWVPRNQGIRSGSDRRDGRDRREKPRPRVLNIEATATRLDFVLLEISPYGLSIETRHPVTIGLTYPMKIRHKQATTTVNARVAWCKLHRTIRVGADDFEPLYRAGLELEGRGIGPLGVLGAFGEQGEGGS